MCLVEFVGPSRFSHWSSDGQPVGIPHPAAWVQVTAVNQAQTTNTMALIPSLMSEEFKARYDITDGAVLIRANGGRQRLEAVTSSYRALEGKRTTFTLLNEALALDTPIPTPSGWTTMGELKDGDVIFGADGHQTVVTKAHEVQGGRDCFRVTFDDGNSIVASDGHWWKVRAAKNRRCPIRQMTTLEMFEAGREFYLPESFGTLNLPDADLPIDPYVLGLWLGDGSKSHGVIAVDGQDRAETMQLIAEAGEPVRVRDENHLALTQGPRAQKAASFKARLRAIGVLDNKHIPVEYLRADKAQRLALLQGLMDSDGHVRRGGQARFANCDKNLLVQVEELLVSLGYHVKTAKFQVRPDLPEWSDLGVISFKAIESVNPFRLSRKAMKVRGERSVTRSRLRRIVSIEPVASVPVRCISVDAEDKLFLAGRGMHATRNTHHWVLGNNGHKMYETIDGNATKKDSRYLAITNAFLPGEDSVAERMRHTYNQILEGRAQDTGWMYDSLEASSRAPLSGPLLPLVLERVRGDATWLVINTIIQSISDTTIAASRSRRMWLNQVVAEEEALHGPETWDPLLDPGAALMPGDEIVLGFDGGKTDDATALVAMRLSDNLVVPIGVWERPAGPEGEGWEVDQRAVDSRVHQTFSTYKVRAFFADVALWESYITDWSTTYGETLGVKASDRYAVGWDMRQSLQRSTRAHEALLQAILDQKIKHDGDLTLRRHVMNAQRAVNNYGVSFRKESRESTRKVDAYAAMMLAYLAATEYRNRGKKIKIKTGRGYFL